MPYKCAKKRQEYHKKYSLKWNNKNRKKCLKYQKKYKEKNIEKFRIADNLRHRVYRALHKEKILDGLRKSYYKNREKILKQKKEYYKKNKEKIINNSKSWAKRNPEKRRLIVNVQASKRRKRERLNGDKNITIDQWRLLVNNNNGICPYCNKKTEKFVKDHMIPLCKGGGNILSNIMAVCAGCNFKKGRKLISELDWISDKIKRSHNK